MKDTSHFPLPKFYLLLSLAKYRVKGDNTKQPKVAEICWNYTSAADTRETHSVSHFITNHTQSALGVEFGPATLPLTSAVRL
jgi:hypothetical protein